MPLPRVLSRSIFAAATIAILLMLMPRAQAADPIGGKAAISSGGTGRLVFTPSNLRFGRIPIGRQKLLMVTMTNVTDSIVTLLQVTTRGRDFTVRGLDLPLTLTSGESFTFTCVYAPRSPGDRSGSISFLSDVSTFATPIPSLEITGAGVDQNGLIVTPATMNFGTVQVGSSGSQGGTLTAAGTQVTIFSAEISNLEFVLSGLSFPLTIPAGGSQGFSVAFTPQSSGTETGTVSFMDVSGTVPLAVESLDGVGIGSQGHSVELSWNASTSQNVIGYNVYRGTTSGGPYSKINSVLDASTVYTDTSVTDGNTYYYVTTAVNSDNEESAYSNQAQATIP